MKKPVKDIRGIVTDAPTRTAVIVLGAIAAVLLVLTIAVPPERRGDGNEYYLMTISLADHLGPNLREGDVAEFHDLVQADSETSTSFGADIRWNINPVSGFIKTGASRTFSVHFWAYSLLAAPVFRVLQFIHMDPLKALQITNALLVIFAATIVLLYSGFGPVKRWLFLALVLVSPGMWYLGWSGAEMFSYAFVVASIACYSRRSFAGAVLCSAVASTQNPPIVFLALFFLIYAAVIAIRDRRYVKLIPVAGAALPAVIPMAYNYIAFNQPNIIYAIGKASFGAISFQRTMSFFFDLDQGMLPYALPVTLLFTFLLLRSWRQRHWLIYGITAVILAMTLLSETTLNWNSDCEGIIRYAVWILPLFFWGIIVSLDLKRNFDRILLGLALAAQLAIVIAYPPWIFPAWFIPHQEDYDHGVSGFLHHSPQAIYVLDNHPSLYNPEPEIFTERTVHDEVDYPDYLPVVYFREDGAATKVLTDYQSLDILGQRGNLAPDLLENLKARYQDKGGVFYIDLSPGEMRLKS